LINDLVDGCEDDEIGGLVDGLVGGCEDDEVGLIVSRWLYDSKWFYGGVFFSFYFSETTSFFVLTNLPLLSLGLFMQITHD
jgi:hypothetical protein